MRSLTTLFVLLIAAPLVAHGATCTLTSADYWDLTNRNGWLNEGGRFPTIPGVRWSIDLNATDLNAVQVAAFPLNDVLVYDSDDLEVKVLERSNGSEIGRIALTNQVGPPLASFVQPLDEDRAIVVRYTQGPNFQFDSEYLFLDLDKLKVYGRINFEDSIIESPYLAPNGDLYAVETVYDFSNPFNPQFETNLHRITVNGSIVSTLNIDGLLAETVWAGFIQGITPSGRLLIQTFSGGNPQAGRFNAKLHLIREDLSGEVAAPLDLGISNGNTVVLPAIRQNETIIVPDPTDGVNIYDRNLTLQNTILQGTEVGIMIANSTVDEFLGQVQNGAANECVRFDLSGQVLMSGFDCSFSGNQDTDGNVLSFEPFFRQYTLEDPLGNTLWTFNVGTRNEDSVSATLDRCRDELYLSNGATLWSLTADTNVTLPTATPTATPTITPTPTPSKRPYGTPDILMAGFWQTDLDAKNGGTVTFAALAQWTDGGGGPGIGNIWVSYGDQQLTNLQYDAPIPGLFGGVISIPANGIPSGSYLLESQAISAAASLSSEWPYLKVWP